MNLDWNHIVSVVASLDVPPLAREAGMTLVDAWIDKHGVHDAQSEILAVETGFLIMLDDKTAAIGVQDLIDRDPIGVRGNEWKSAKEPRRDAKGRETSWWNEDVWRKELSNGSQIALYALALNRGTYFEALTGARFQFDVAQPRVRIRAAVKSNPVRFWPSD